MTKIILLCFILLLPLLSYSQEEELVKDSKANQGLYQKISTSFDEKSASFKTDSKAALEGMSKSFINEQMKKTLEEFVKGNPLSELDRDTLESTIVERLPDNKVGNYIKESPKFRAFIIDIIHDKDTLPGFARIGLNRKDLTRYGFISLGILALYLFGGYFMTRKKRYFTDRLKIKIPLFFLCTFGQLGVFLFIFQKDIKPFIQILSKHVL